MPPQKQPGAASLPAASRPAVVESRPAGVGNRVRIATGVDVDFRDRQVRAAGHIVLNAGPIEFLACRSGKEHESIVLLDGTATDLFRAIGLLGFEFGSPPRWDESAKHPAPASGDLVEVAFEWTANGQPRRAAWTDWLLDAEYAASPPAQPLVFAGSLPTPDGRRMADLSGAAIALVDKGDGVLCAFGNRSERDSELWAVVNSALVPPPGTPVTLVVSPAKPRSPTFALDFRGDLRLDGRIMRTADVANQIAIARRVDPSFIATIGAHDALRADVERARAALAQAGLSGVEFRFEHGATSAPSPHR